VAAVCIASLSPVANAVLAGAAAGMDITLVRNIKDYVVPVIIRDINNLRIGRLDHKNGYIENIVIQLALLNKDSVQFSFDPAQNAVVFTVNNIQGQITGDFHQKVLFFTSRGHFKVTF
jgi:hypothetical protein